MKTIKTILVELACENFNRGTLNDDKVDESVDQALSEIQELLDGAIPYIHQHICRFNDGECVCDCYKAGRNEYKENIRKVIR